MTQLLISVKSLEEALLVKHTGVGIVDLKDPNIGALGALDVDVVSQILPAVGSTALVSATVGEGHADIDALAADIQLYANLGVDVMKVAVSNLFQHEVFLERMLRLTAKGIRIVAVFFAEQEADLDLIIKLESSGFYGVMFDTQDKSHSLQCVQSAEQLQRFVEVAKAHGLMVGLAGSVSQERLVSLLDIRPDFIGMRGGVCENQARTTALDSKRVEAAQSVLLNYNNKLG